MYESAQNNVQLGKENPFTLVWSFWLMGCWGGKDESNTLCTMLMLLLLPYAHPTKVKG